MARRSRLPRVLLVLLLCGGLGAGYYVWRSDRRARRIASVTTAPAMQATAPSVAPVPAATAGPYTLLPPFGGELPPPILLPRPAEPSGATYLEELRGFLVVDDESTLGQQRGVHFLIRRRGGQLEEVSVRLDESALAFQWDDLEAVAASPDQVFFLASHAYDSSWRQRLCHAPRPRITRKLAKGGTPRVSIHQLWCMPERSSRTGIQQALATATGAADFDLEGLAWSPGEERFLIGVRAPLAGGKAVLLSMDTRTEQGAAYPFFAVAHTLDLGGRGVRGMTFLDDHRLLIAAGPSGDGPGRFDLFLVDLAGPEAERAPHLLTPAGFPARAAEGRQLRIEGLAFDGEGLLVLCDSGEWAEEEPPGAPAYAFYLPLAPPGDAARGVGVDQ